MFSRLFGKPKPEPTTAATFEKLVETLEILEKKKNILQRKIALEVEKEKECIRAKNKRAAMQCIKRKKLYEVQAEQLRNFQLGIHDQMIVVDGAKATTETVEALRAGAAVMKAIQKTTSIDDVDKSMDEINDQTQNIKQIQDSLSAPIGAVSDLDQDALKAELKELERAELEEKLLQPEITAPDAPLQAVSAHRHLIRPSTKRLKPQTVDEEDELAAFQAEMALYLA